MARRHVLRGPKRDRKRQCRNKVRYPKEIAVRVAAELTEGLGQRLDAYFCRYCGWWHIGHPSNKKRGDHLGLPDHVTKPIDLYLPSEHGVQVVHLEPDDELPAAIDALIHDDVTPHDKETSEHDAA